MLGSLKDLEQYELSATDGDVGKVVNFLLDDERWTVRYLIAQTGSFFSDRRVLISPISLRQTDWSTRQFHVALRLYDYHGRPVYWGAVDRHLGPEPGPVASPAAMQAFAARSILGAHW